MLDCRSGPGIPGQMLVLSGQTSPLGGVCFIMQQGQWPNFDIYKQMKINFTYNEDKDIECLLTLGIGKIHEPGLKTKTYEELLAFTPDVGNPEKVREFVRYYISKNGIDLLRSKDSLQRSWDSIADRFEARAERIFGIKIAHNINAYMTITGRYPYYVFDEDKCFYVPADKENANATAMHELWHFYTSYKFGSKEVENEERFSVPAEALTVLLNSECADLMGGVIDDRYPQYARLRETVADEWARSKDINKVWDTLRSSWASGS